jgi:hypothetical protein
MILEAGKPNLGGSRLSLPSSPAGDGGPWREALEWFAFLRTPGTRPLAGDGGQPGTPREELARQAAEVCLAS